MKLAIGEEVPEENSSNSEEDTEVDELGELSSESESGLEEEPKDESGISQSISENTKITTDNNGVEALKKLLQALSNEDVVASMKNMEININITLGDK